MLPLNLPELEVSGLALVTAIDDCPPNAGGEGSVVTAWFVTREVHVVASVDVLGADGTHTYPGTVPRLSAGTVPGKLTLRARIRTRGLSPKLPEITG